ncbi:MAG: aspartate aminotransferase family protein [Acidobacteriota bacterium]|jgi:acetylornithine/N-succinyldiaminopimelate aminotransferase|nr:aspartate aminotransferase family protein [Acidobacteriota bacterium]NLT32376.1 aspartate aminotransferase family protein [Acidobacteriota bacterium]
MSSRNTFETEDRYMAPFFIKQKIAIDRGEGVYVWDEEGVRYLDFTAGWGVTCMGHAHPVITEALARQSRKILQGPNSGLTYSPARAELLLELMQVLPPNLTRVFFSNSGAEANDAAIKLARKVTGRLDVISTHQSFHGRTISTTSATGQASHREIFNPLMPNYRFVAYGDLAELEQALDDNVAAFIIEPIQGEGGVHIPSREYLRSASRLCRQNGALLIADEVQTGFCRTGPMFVTGAMGVEVDFLTMAKGIAGGFPFGGFAMTEAVAQKLEIGDHGGTYCGNPLGCAVSAAVIRYLRENNISAHVEEMGRICLDTMAGWKDAYPAAIREIRGQGLLIMVEFADADTAKRVSDDCLARGLFVRQTQGVGIRVFPALTITEAELREGLGIMAEAIRAVAG